jgi:hypothetical protein
MVMHHPLGVFGLGTNVIGTVLLLFFPPKVEEFTPDGLKISGGGAFSELPVSDTQKHERQRQFRRRKRTFRAGFAFLLIGFSLQLIDLLVT